MGASIATLTRKLKEAIAQYNDAVSNSRAGSDLHAVTTYEQAIKFDSTFWKDTSIHSDILQAHAAIDLFCKVQRNLEEIHLVIAESARFKIHVQQDAINLERYLELDTFSPNTAMTGTVVTRLQAKAIRASVYQRPSAICSFCTKAGITGYLPTASAQTAFSFTTHSTTVAQLPLDRE
jgi:hypothetical protein